MAGTMRRRPFTPWRDPAAPAPLAHRRLRLRKLAAAQETLGPCSQGKREMQPARRADCRFYPHLRMVEVKKRLLRVAAEILDSAADQPGRRGKAYRLSHP